MSTQTTATPSATKPETDPKKVGSWGNLFNTARVAVHASLLPNGRILCWGRRANPKDDKASLDEHFTKPFFIDLPLSKSGLRLVDEGLLKNQDMKNQDIKNPPAFLDKVNLFCSGHCIQPDGNLFIAGGHEKDGKGIDQACVYDWDKNTWTSKPAMNDGRWYPGVLTLPDGNTLVISGSHDEAYTVSNIPQIWHQDSWITMPSPPAVSPLYPKLHLDPKGRVFVAGPQAQSQLLNMDTKGIVSWAKVDAMRGAVLCEYGSSVMYENGKVLWTGGGMPPTKTTEIIDLSKDTLKWTQSSDMQRARRQHNATVLPDGSVLVTGGTQGDGQNHSDFNDLRPGQPVHEAELWNPSTQQWTLMAKEDCDRCYHAIALLLPNGQVLSAGGGEYGGGLGPNSLTNGQLFTPPYLCQGVDRPTIQSPIPPESIDYGKDLTITVGPNDTIKQVSWIRIGSVTHTTNMNQSLTFLSFKQTGPKLVIKLPATTNITPPGHYMLFIINQQGVPNIAPILKIPFTPAPNPPVKLAQRVHMAKQVAISLPDLNAKVMTEHEEEQEKYPVVVGLTPSCPYGLGPCWAGAFEGLKQIQDISIVRPVPNQADSIAFVYLKDENKIPDIEVWRKEFAITARGSYVLRRIEMTVDGVVKKLGEELVIRDGIVLRPYTGESSVRYDIGTREVKGITEKEAGAYAELVAAVNDSAEVKVKVVGTIQKQSEGKFSFDVREFKVL